MPRRRLADEYEQPVVAVTGWDVQWLFSIPDPKHGHDAYRDVATLTLAGDVHRPARSRYPAARIELTGQVELPEPALPHPAIGYVEHRSGLLYAYIRVPADRLAMLTAAADRIRLVSLLIVKLAPRRRLVRSLHVDTAFNPEEW